jgi:hypothetical protein
MAKTKPKIPPSDLTAIAASLSASADVTATPSVVAPDSSARTASTPPSASTSPRKTANRKDRADEHSRKLRALYWPTVPDSELWIMGNGRSGFAQVPRTLSYVMLIINECAKAETGKAMPVARTYMTLWLRSFGNGLVKVESETEAAFEAGYGGERNLTTFRRHMGVLRDLGFIDFRRGPKGPSQFVLMRNPYIVVKQLHDAGRVSDELFGALMDRAEVIGSSGEFEGAA